MLCIVGRECREQPEVARAVQAWAETGTVQPPRAVFVSPKCRLCITCLLLHSIWSLLRHSPRLPDHGGHCCIVSLIYCNHRGQDCILSIHLCS